MTPEQTQALYDVTAIEHRGVPWERLSEQNRKFLLAFARNVASYALGEKTEQELEEAKREATGAFIAYRSACDSGSSGDVITSANALVLANERVAKLLAEPMPSYAPPKPPAGKP